MRIAHLSWETLHSIPVGGISAHVTELAAAEDRRGHEVHVFTRIGEGQDPYERIDGVHYHRCPFELNPDMLAETDLMGNSFVYFMGETEAHQGGHFDIVHAHDWLCAKALIQAKNDRGRRTVFTVHSTEYGRCGNHNHSGGSGRIRDVEYEGTYVADRVITVSSALADEVRWQYQVPEWKLRVVHNGIDCTRYDGRIDPAISRGNQMVGPLDPMILFVGRLCTQKGPDLLLDAMPGILDRHPATKLVLVGDGHMRSLLEQRAQEKGIAQAVRFTGSMAPNGEVVNLFKSCDVVCVPSRNEPFGIVVLEAWAAGKPVIATRNGGPRDFVAHGEDGYLVNDDAFSIFTAVCDLLDDSEHARWMGGRGRVKAASGFKWSSIAEQTEAVYHEVL